MNKAFWISQLQMFCTLEQVKNSKCQSDRCLFYYIDHCLENREESLQIVSQVFSTNLSSNIDKFLELFIYHESGSCQGSDQNHLFIEELFNLQVTRFFECSSDTQDLGCFHFKIPSFSLFEPKKNLEPFLKGFFCEKCRSFHQDSLKVLKIPANVFIVLESQNNPSAIENLRVFQNVPFALTGECFGEPENLSDLKLSSMVLSDSENSFLATLNKSRLWDIPYLQKQDCSLFDMICDLLLEGFYPIQLHYSKRTRGPFKIGLKAWQELNSRFFSSKNLTTFSCGKIREQNCLCCSSIRTRGWKCSCGKTNQLSLCKCGKFISKCLKCKNFTSIKPCKFCGHEDLPNSSTLASTTTTCPVCSSVWDSRFKVCRTCLNPDPSVFLFSD